MEASTTKTSESSDWVECESKRNPGKRYLFNKATGESKWLSSNNGQKCGVEVQKVKAPANERLKRLQRELHKPRTLDKLTKNNNSENESLHKTKKILTSGTSAVKKSQKVPLTPKERLRRIEENVKTVKSSTKVEEKKLPANQNVEESEKVAKTVEPSAHRKPQESISVEKFNSGKQKNLNKNSVNISKRFKIPKKVEKNKKLDKTVTSLKSIEKVNTTQKQQEVIEEVVLKKKPVLTEKFLKETVTKVTANELLSSKAELSTPTNFLYTIEQKLEQSAATSPELKQVEKTEQTEKPLQAFNFEKTSSIHESSALINSPSHTDVVNDTSFKIPGLKFLANCISTPLSHLKSKANERLKRLRQNLQNNSITNSTFYTIDKNSNTLKTPDSNSNSNSEYEEMDWEPSFESTSTWSLSSPAVSNASLDEPTEMEVDENLMLDAAAKTNDSCQHISKKWLKDHIYIVLDTNVFINYLDFIEVLKNHKPLDSAGVILYLPYSVLQELDKLKQRENIKFQVIRAIRYLNKMFETKDAHVQAQSALENRRHLIDVDIVDDNILNTCLQVREYIPSVILLTEDVNLRNKAICNDIKVLTKKDFLKNGFQKP